MRFGWRRTAVGGCESETSSPLTASRQASAKPAARRRGAPRLRRLGLRRAQLRELFPQELGVLEEDDLVPAILPERPDLRAESLEVLRPQRLPRPALELDEGRAGVRVVWRQQEASDELGSVFSAVAELHRDLGKSTRRVEKADAECIVRSLLLIRGLRVRTWHRPSSATLLKASPWIADMASSSSLASGLSPAILEGTRSIWGCSAEGACGSDAGAPLPFLPSRSKPEVGAPTVKPEPSGGTIVPPSFLRAQTRYYAAVFHVEINRYW